MKIHDFLTCKVTLKLLLIYAIQSVSGGLTFYISLFLKSNTPLNVLQIGSLVSAIALGNILGGYVAGHISDKYNPFYAIKQGLVIQGVALIALIFAKNLTPLYVIMFFLGFGSYYYTIASNFILNSKYNDDAINRTKMISFQHIVANVGGFGAAILMGYCAEGYYISIFSSMALVMIAIGIVLKPVDKTFCLAVENKKNKPVHQNSSSKLYLLGLLGVVILGIIYSQHRVAYPIFLKENFGNVHTGYLLSLNPIIIIFFQAFIIRLASRFNELFSFGLGLLFLGMSFLILNGPINLSIIVSACVFMTLGEILGFTLSQSIAFGYVCAEKRGRVLGLYKSLYSGTKIVGAYFAGTIINYLSYKSLWFFCFALSLLGFIFIVSCIPWSKRIAVNTLSDVS